MSTWTTQTRVYGTPAEVLEVLVDPAACARWSPVSFEVDGVEDGRLTAGSRAEVRGRLGGLSLSFAVTVHEAGDGRLALSAEGPIALDVEYEAYAADGPGCEVWATVTVRGGRGFTGRLAAASTEALLRGGALAHALDRIATEVTRRVQEPALA